VGSLFESLSSVLRPVSRFWGVLDTIRTQGGGKFSVGITLAALRVGTLEQEALNLIGCVERVVFFLCQSFGIALQHRTNVRVVGGSALIDTFAKRAIRLKAGSVVPKAISILSDSCIANLKIGSEAHDWD
jgi:hypothetical protein